VSGAEASSRTASRGTVGRVSPRIGAMACTRHGPASPPAKRTRTGAAIALGPCPCRHRAAGRELPGVRELRRLLRVRLFAVLDEDLVDLSEQGVHELVLGIDADDLPLPEDRALPHPTGAPDVRVLGLAGPVHLAAHDCDLHG